MILLSHNICSKKHLSQWSVFLSVLFLQWLSVKSTLSVYNYSFDISWQHWEFLNVKFVDAGILNSVIFICLLVTFIYIVSFCLPVLSVWISTVSRCLSFHRHFSATAHCHGSCETTYTSVYDFTSWVSSTEQVNNFSHFILLFLCSLYTWWSHSVHRLYRSMSACHCFIWNT